jgi:hypothetical protein
MYAFQYCHSLYIYKVSLRESFQTFSPERGCFYTGQLAITYEQKMATPEVPDI